MPLKWLRAEVGEKERSHTKLVVFKSKEKRKIHQEIFVGMDMFNILTVAVISQVCIYICQNIRLYTLNVFNLLFVIIPQQNC